MLEAEVSYEEAVAYIDQAKGFVRKAIELAQQTNG